MNVLKECKNMCYGDYTLQKYIILFIRYNICDIFIWET